MGRSAFLALFLASALPLLPQAPASSSAVEVIAAPAPDQSVLAARKSSYSFKLPADGSGDSGWLDTGVTIAAGDHIEFTSSGTIRLADGREAGPDGLPRGWKDLLRVYADNSSGAGAVIARVGDADVAVPFAVGAGKTMDATQTGKLYLCVNGGDGSGASGSFTVKIKLSRPRAARTTAAGATAAAVPSAASPDLKTLVSPALFADIPRRVSDLDGNPGDMVNFALAGSEEDVKQAFASAGWTPVDKTTEDAVLHGLVASLMKQSYTEMPMSTLYLFGRPQDLSYALADPLAVAAIRHHLRVWKTEKSLDGRPLWVGSATHDNGVEKDQRTGGVTHHIDPNIDEERDFL
jgi:hypothetical protein